MIFDSDNCEWLKNKNYNNNDDDVWCMQLVK